MVGNNSPTVVFHMLYISVILIVLALIFLYLLEVSFHGANIFRQSRHQQRLQSTLLNAVRSPDLAFGFGNLLFAFESQ